MHIAFATALARPGKQLPLKSGSFYAELLTPHPDGISYAETESDAVAGKLFGLHVRIASVPALMRMKEQAAHASTGLEQRKHLDDLERLSRY